MNQTLKSMKMKIRIHVLMRNWVDEAWNWMNRESWIVRRMHERWKWL
jgi:hypothetical protein